MKVYVNLIEIIGFALFCIAGLFMLFLRWADRYTRNHRNALTRFLDKLFGIKR